MPRARLAIIICLMYWIVLGAVVLYGLRKPQATFVPIPQVLTESKDHEDYIYYVASFPYATNDIAVQFYRRGLKDDMVRLGRTKLWLANSERGVDFKAIPVSRIGGELAFDDYPPASSLTIKARGPKEALYCGDAQGYHSDPVYYQRDWQTGELSRNERQPDVEEPCYYDTLRIQFADGDEHSFYIGTVSVAPHYVPLHRYDDYISVNYRPISRAEAWRTVMLCLFAVLGLVAGPVWLGVVLRGRAAYIVGVCATVAIFLLLNFKLDEYFVVEDAARRIGMRVWISMAPLLSVHVASFTSSWLFRRYQKGQDGPPSHKA